MSQKCSYDPSSLIDVPLGMFHCPECGEMVLAGMAHPDYSLIETPPNKRLHWTLRLLVWLKNCVGLGSRQ